MILWISLLWSLCYMTLRHIQNLAKIVSGWKQLSISAKSSILDYCVNEKIVRFLGPTINRVSYSRVLKPSNSTILYLDFSIEIYRNLNLLKMMIYLHFRMHNRKEKSKKKILCSHNGFYDSFDTDCEFQKSSTNNHIV